jgi:lipoprotein-anchoring transpeptidase ErfK/SrfK
LFFLFFLFSAAVWSQTFYSTDSPAATYSQNTVPQPQKAILVFLSIQEYICLENDSVVRRGQVSTGKKDMPTPAGEYKIQYKVLKQKYTDKDTGQSCWLTNFMPFWGNYAIHGIAGQGQYAAYEKYLGRRASHGCVRVSRQDGEWLYTWAAPGIKVNILKEIPEKYSTLLVGGKSDS